MSPASLYQSFLDGLLQTSALEFIAVLAGIASVWFSKKEQVLVYPVGLINTTIFVYLSFKGHLLGEASVNIYYTVMSIYGWWLWSQKKENQVEYPIAKVSKKDIGLGIVIFIITVVFVVLVYHFFNKFTSWTAYVDTFTTGVFFVGMWLMAKRKIENWILWIIGDIVSIPLYFSKGYTFTSLQYVIFTVIAIYAYKEWKRNLVN